MVVASDGVATPFADLHEASLRSMGSVFARVANTDEIVSGTE
jgi:hypothetical protein